MEYQTLCSKTEGCPVDYQMLCKKLWQYQEMLPNIPCEVLSKFNKAFEVEYTHNSTAIEGNTLSLIQAKVVLEDGLSVSGKALHEIYEVANHARAFNYVKDCISKNKYLEQQNVKEIHARLMENIQVDSISCDMETRIADEVHHPFPDKTYRQVRDFFSALCNPLDLNVIEMAAWTHAEFVRLHPFMAGNGLTARMIMNYQLMSAGFLPISISKKQSMEYFKAMKSYVAAQNLRPFTEMIGELERQRLDEYMAIDCEHSVKNPDIEIG